MYRIFFYTSILFFFISGCGSSHLDDFTDVKFQLVNQNNETVIFPDDFQGKPLVIGFIYTHCPDICSFITANVKKVHDEFDSPESANYVLVTFDPERDTPEVLNSYANSFNINQSEFHFLTGEPEIIEEMMDRMSVRTQESYSRELEDGERLYFINHTDKILLIDQQSRLVFDYGGSMTPPNLIVEDLEKL